MAATKCPYFNKVNNPKTIAAEAGSKYHKTYEVQLDENGHKELVQTGETNIYDEIQSYKEDCLIENILARAGVGDMSGFRNTEGEYIDCTQLPTTLAEAQKTILKIKNEFYKLTPEQREVFGNSAEEYVAQYGGEKWANTMGYVKEVVEEIAETVETVEESTNE